MKKSVVNFYDLLAKKNLRPHGDNAPRCARCAIRRADGYIAEKRVPFVEEVERSTYSVTLRARCHGDEHTVRVEFPAMYDDTELEAVGQAIRFFDDELHR